jgi:hypothetical protein
LREVAAGMIRSELTTRSPTQGMLTATTSATIQAKKAYIAQIFTPRLCARLC